MVVQYINSGFVNTIGENKNFQLALPGGGVNQYTRGCSTQWNTKPDGWGGRYSGVTKRIQCEELPDSLRSGCYFWFDFLKRYTGTTVSYEEVKCPKEIIERTKCEYQYSD